MRHSVAFALAMTGLVVASVAHAQSRATVGELLRQACVETGMDRAAFEALGSSRGWRAVQFRRMRGADDGWTIGYAVEDARIFLSKSGGGIDDLTCTVSYPDPSESWREEIGEIARSLEASPLSGLSTPNADETKAWIKPGAGSLSYNYTVATDTVIATRAGPPPSASGTL